MFAVIRTGGKQYKVATNDVLSVEKLVGEVGSTLTLSEVLLVGGDSPKSGAPLVAGASVEAEIVEQGQRRQGHRLQEEAPQEHPSEARSSPALHQGEDHRDPRELKDISHGT